MPTTVLMSAGTVECARLLLDRGADVNASDLRGATALAFRTREGNVGLVEFSDVERCAALRPNRLRRCETQLAFARVAVTCNPTPRVQPHRQRQGRSESQAAHLSTIRNSTNPTLPSLVLMQAQSPLSNRWR